MLHKVPKRFVQYTNLINFSVKFDKKLPNKVRKSNKINQAKTILRKKYTADMQKNAKKRQKERINSPSKNRRQS